MVDKLRRVLDELEPPACPSCRIDMKWTRSSLVDADTIEHLFYCPNCGGTGEATSKVRVIIVPPDKLGAPAIERAA
jgi:hypothetical protein